MESYSRQYDYYQDALKSAITGMPSDVKGKIEERLAVIKHAFFPVIESNLYCNYKAFDEVLVEKIPFILTILMFLPLQWHLRTVNTRMVEMKQYLQTYFSNCIKP